MRASRPPSTRSSARAASSAVSTLEPAVEVRRPARRPRACAYRLCLAANALPPLCGGGRIVQYASRPGPRRTPAPRPRLLPGHPPRAAPGSLGRLAETLASRVLEHSRLASSDSSRVVSTPAGAALGVSMTPASRSQHGTINRLIEHGMEHGHTDRTPYTSSSRRTPALARG
eukprot:scaffold19621_cov54-Phaeocystis_antarctica.AAC.2